MNIAKNVTRLLFFVKALFLIQGLLLLAIGIKDVILYRCPENVDVQCTRVVSVTWLVVGFAIVHLISGIFTFFYSCTTTIYQPIICFVLWSICVCSLVFYHVKQLHGFEQVLSTNLAIGLAIVTTYVLLMLAEIILHVNLVCLQQRGESIDNDVYEFIVTTSRPI